MGESSQSDNPVMRTLVKGNGFQCDYSIMFNMRIISRS